MHDLARHIAHRIQWRGDHPLQRRRQDQGREQAERDHDRQDAKVSDHAPDHVVAGLQQDGPQPLAVAHDLRRQLHARADGVGTAIRADTGPCQPWRWRRRPRAHIVAVQLPDGEVQRRHQQLRTRLQRHQVALGRGLVVERQRRRQRHRQDARFGRKIRRPRPAVIRQVMPQQRGARHQERNDRGRGHHAHQLAAHRPAGAAHRGEFAPGEGHASQHSSHQIVLLVGRRVAHGRCASRMHGVVAAEVAS